MTTMDDKVKELAEKIIGEHSLCEIISLANGLRAHVIEVQSPHFPVQVQTNGLIIAPVPNFNGDEYGEHYTEVY